MKHFLTQLKFLPASIKMVWQATPRWTSLWLALVLIQGVLPVATVYITKRIVDDFSEVASAGSVTLTSLQPALFSILLMAVILMTAAALKSLNQWVQTAQSECVQDHIKDRIHTKAISLDLSFYENADFYDSLHRANVDAVHRPLSLIQSVGLIVQSIVTLSAMIVILTTYNAWLPPLLILGSLPALYVALKFSFWANRLRLQQTVQFRKSHYYSSVITERESASESRLFSLGTYFRNKYRSTRKKLRTEIIDLSKKQAIAEFIARVAGLVSMCGAIAWASYSILRKGGSLGDLALIYQAFNQGQQLMQTLLSNVRQLYVNLMFVDNLFSFLNIQSKIAEPLYPAQQAKTLEKEIVLNNVSFRYPGSKQQSLNDFNLNIPAGKITAIVGANGAGKSTLIKLLTRLYDANDGEILIDGECIKSIPIDQLRSMYTTMFQTPVRYQMSAFQNISISKWNDNATQLQIEEAAADSGAHHPINKLPNEYETVLGKLFGGSDLSGGEWQRIALARAFLRKSAVVLLDEPTSQMDSWAEAKWMQRFRHLVDGQTAVIITHRFTTALKADMIHVMHNGNITESGTHSELVNAGGRYMESWNKQISAHQ